MYLLDSSLVHNDVDMTFKLANIHIEVEKEMERDRNA